MKRRQIITTAVTLFIYSIVFTSCKNTSTKITTDNGIKFDSISVNENYYLLGDTSNPHCTLLSKFIYPTEYADNDILQKTKQIFTSAFFGDENNALSPKDAMNEYVQKYISDYKGLETDFKSEKENTDDTPSAESWFSYNETSSNQIVYNKCNLISFVVQIEYFTGGAHGGHSYNNHVINLKTGEELKEEDIFIENYQDDLAKIIVNEIAADNNLTEPSELEKMGFFNIKEIYPNKNFYVNEDGITYTYNEYEIAAYFVGAVTVAIPYENIRHILKEDSPITPIAFIEK